MSECFSNFHFHFLVHSYSVCMRLSLKLRARAHVCVRTRVCVNEGTCHYLNVEVGGPSCVLVLILHRVWERCLADDCHAYQTSWPVSFWILLSPPHFFSQGPWEYQLALWHLAFLWVPGIWSQSSDLGSVYPLRCLISHSLPFLHRHTYVISSQKCLVSYFHFTSRLVMETFSFFEQYSAFLLLPRTKNLIPGLLDTKRVIYLTVSLFFTFTNFTKLVDFSYGTTDFLLVNLLTEARMFSPLVIWTFKIS